MTKEYPEYKKFVHNGELYARLKGALYGCKQSALLWYRNVKDTLVAQGCTLDTCLPCGGGRIDASVNGLVRTCEFSTHRTSRSDQLVSTVDSKIFFSVAKV
jgi:hypothetical protein